jgi:hypothetical protein
MNKSQYAAQIAALGLSVFAAVVQSTAAQAQSMKPRAAAVARACRTDLNQYCAGVQRGGGRIVACLKANQDKLSPACQNAFAAAMQSSAR